MACSRCGGFLWAPDPEEGLKCAICGRSVLPLLTEARLKAMGITIGKYVPHDFAPVGQHRRGMEYSPAPFRPPGRHYSDSRYERGR